MRAKSRIEIRISLSKNSSNSKMNATKNHRPNSPYHQIKQKQQIKSTQYTEFYLEDISDLIFSSLNNIDYEYKEGHDQIINEISQRLISSSKLISKCYEYNQGSRHIAKLYTSDDKNKLAMNYLPEKVMQFPRKTLLLDLDETLIHSTFISTGNKSDITLTFNTVTNNRTIYVHKRPNVDEFLMKMSKYYELIIFTASVSEYANPVLNELDKAHIIKYRLYRENCVYHNNGFIKDLSKLGRKLKDTILLDNNPISYINNKENGIPISSWYSDKRDNELAKLVSFLEYLAFVDDVRPVISMIVQDNKINWLKANKILMSKHKTKSWTNSQTNIVSTCFEFKNKAIEKSKLKEEERREENEIIEDDDKISNRELKTVHLSAKKMKKNDYYLSDINIHKVLEEQKDMTTSRNQNGLNTQSNSLNNNLKKSEKKMPKVKKIKKSLIHLDLNKTLKKINYKMINDINHPQNANATKKTVSNILSTSNQVINSKSKFNSLFDRLLIN